MTLALVVPLVVGVAASQAAVGGSRAVLLSPFSVGSSIRDYSGHDTSGWGEARDMYDVYQPVKVNLVSSDGPVKFRVFSVGAASAGTRVVLEVLVNEAVVGRLGYSHLVGVPGAISAAVGSGTTFSPGTTVGYTAPNTTYPSASCGDGTAHGFAYIPGTWEVCTSGGIHVHLDVYRGCYLNQNYDWPALAAGEAIGMLSSAYAPGNKSLCDAAEVARVQVVVKPWVAPTVTASGWYTEQPVAFQYTIKNAGSGPVTMALVIVAVRDPYGVNRDVLCAGGRNVTLGAGQTFQCRVSWYFPWQGDYTYFPAWQDTGGGWHSTSELWASRTFRLSSSIVGVSGSQSRSAPYGNYVGVPITFTYKIKNSSPYAVIGMPWVTNGVRNPSGGNRDAVCNGGQNLTLNAGQTLTCTATKTFWTKGTYKYWPAWQGPSQQWHGTSELWPEQSFTLLQSIVPSVAPTATVGGTAGTFPRRVTFTFTIKNQADGSVTLPLVFVAFRDPAGRNIDVPCNGSQPVTIGAKQTYKCVTSRYVDSRGTYTYWPSWRDPEGAFHDLAELWSMKSFTISS
jgi:hypothetical protein